MFTRKTAKPKGVWIKAAAVEEVPPEGLRAVQTDGGPIVLAKLDGHIYALEDRCSHQDYPLSAPAGRHSSPQSPPFEPSRSRYGMTTCTCCWTEPPTRPTNRCGAGLVR